MKSQTPKVSVSETIFNTLRKEIIYGTYKQGQRIVELEVAKRFSCSQAPVREALQRLEEQGLVNIYKHTGTFVSQISIDEIQELFELRAMIEKRVIRQALYVMTDEDQKRIQRIVDDMFEAAKNNDLNTLIELDMQFHEFFILLSQRQTSLRIWRLIDGQIRRFLTISHPKFFNNLFEVAQSHQDLIDKIFIGVPQDAERAFEEHITLIPEKVKLLRG